MLIPKQRRGSDDLQKNKGNLQCAMLRNNTQPQSELANDRLHQCPQAKMAHCLTKRILILRPPHWTI